ncbi:unnamed protein product [Arctia plantaginis]|uniref:Uncharacterized protein n=1 Tax=Arctia plantaginis TaxID=874455 RepID=A0A8S1ARF1_ARCPL|nr:unnamed protein product [Arctia plantaginis]
MSESMDTQPPTGDAHGNYSQGKRNNFPVRRPRGSRGRGSRGRPNERSTDWRQKQNQSTEARQAALRNSHFDQFNPNSTTDDVVPTIARNTAPPTTSFEYSSVQFLGMATSFGRPLPISTQALGFIVNQYYIKLQEQLGAERVAERCTIHQFYRHSLAQLSYHLYRLRIEEVPRYSYRTNLPDPPIVQPTAVEAFKTLELNVGFIISYIQRIGTVIAHDIPHVPMLMLDDSPFYVTVFNLRTVMARANRDPDFFNQLVEHNI